MKTKMPSPLSMQGSGLRISSAVLACGLLLVASSGCRKRTVMAAPPVIVAPTPAETQPPAAPAAETKTEPAPQTPPATTPPATPAPRPAPRRSNPPPNTPPPENPAPAPPKTPAPQISPQLSPGDQASYERKTNEDIAAAEKNLQQAYGRELNTSQHDLVEKINSFLGQAREAARASDWARASTLAQKAHVLSTELANSF